MKNIMFYLLAILAITVGCDDEDIVPIIPDTPDEISFAGTWSRQFEAGPGNLHTADYFIYQDSIRYTLSGNVGNADYLITRDTFLKENNRFIGHTELDEYYLIFVKNITADSFFLYKQTVENLPEGMSINVPDDNTTENHGWNIYHKK